MNFERSQQYYDRACKTCPGGIHSNVRKSWNPGPMFYERGEGSHIWDVDGNEFIDYVLARGPLLLGHSPRKVLDAVIQQMEQGLMYAGQHRLEIEASEKFCQLVPGADMVRFSCTGSEAVHGAIRLARGVTGRTKILRFEGHYHGWFDNIFWNFAPPLDQAGPRESPVPLSISEGQPLSDGEHLVIRPWNDLALVASAFEQYPGQIAAVLTEPIMCNTGCIMPVTGYLEGLRELCTRHGALLVFDEVITGFRASLGGAQQYFGVTPDVATFAKGIAGGFQVSAIAGRADVMRAFGDLSVAHSGTYNSNGPSMAAAIAAMEMLEADGGAILQHAHVIGKQLMQGIEKAGRCAGKSVLVRGIGPIFNVSFGASGSAAGDSVTDYRSYVSDAGAGDAEAYRRFNLALQERGVRTVPGGQWFVSTAHTQEDVDKTLAAVTEAMTEV